MNITKEKIKETILNFLDQYNFRFYKETKQEWIDVRTDICYKLLTTKEKIIDILINVKNINQYTKSEQDIQQFVYKIIGEYFGLDTRDRFHDTIEELNERMMFRIELYKEGWSIEQIEKYIYKYLYKKEYENIDLDYFECLYHNFMIQHNYSKSQKKKKIGRPQMPDSLKEYIKLRHNNRIRNTMHNKYQKWNDIKDNLLTKEEYDSLVKKIDDQTLLEKLKKFIE